MYCQQYHSATTQMVVLAIFVLGAEGSGLAGMNHVRGGNHGAALRYGHSRFLLPKCRQALRIYHQ
jgi:hypothetical protein